MAIELDGRTYKYPSDRIIVNDRIVKEVYCNGEKVYPEVDVGSHVIKWQASGSTEARIRYEYGPTTTSYRSKVIGTIEYALAASMSFTTDSDGPDCRVYLDNNGRFYYRYPSFGNIPPTIKTYEALAIIKIKNHEGYPISQVYDSDLSTFWKLSRGGTYPISFSFDPRRFREGRAYVPYWIDDDSYDGVTASVDLDSDVYFEVIGGSDRFVANFQFCNYRGRWFSNDSVDLDSVSILNPDESGITYKNFDIRAGEDEVNPITDPNPPSTAYTVTQADVPNIA